VTRVLLVPDLPIERWPSMDRYASRLTFHLRRYAADLDITVSSEIDDLTVDRPGPVLRAGESGPHPIPLLAHPEIREARRYVARYWSYPRRIARMHASLIHVLDHSYAHTIRAQPRIPSVVTVHDLLPVITIERAAASWRDRLRNRLLQRVLDTLRQATAWIVATEWLRGELSAWLGHSERIHVIPYGVDDAFFEEPAPDTRRTTRAHWGIPERAFVVLHVGSVGPRKNLPALFAAVQGLRAGGVDAWLVQVGGSFDREQERDLEARQLSQATVRVGEAAEADLRAAYRAADVLMFPSHYEGFGFPVLEAMASGLPVVTSGVGGLGELAGAAAVVVGGREVEPYVTALKRVAANPAWRAELVAKGLLRAKRFRWMENARQTAAIYRALAPL
jgi:alpha-1,3-rhamnosyl/mannosyltransferase